MKERLRIQGLRKRWILNSVGPVILILVLAAILASATVANNYYGSARSTLEAKAKAGADYFNSYSMSSYSEYYRNASLYAASFDSTRIELQFLNLYGRWITPLRAWPQARLPRPRSSHGRWRAAASRYSAVRTPSPASR